MCVWLFLYTAAVCDIHKTHCGGNSSNGAAWKSFENKVGDCTQTLENIFEHV